MAKIMDLGEGRFGRYEGNDRSWAIVTDKGETVHTGYAADAGAAESAMRAFLGGGDAVAEPSAAKVEEPAAAAEAGEPEPEGVLIADKATEATDDDDEPTDSTKKLRGKLPDGFPGKAALEEAGYGTYAKVRKLHEQGKLTEVPGIGEATAGHIGEALSEG